MKKPLEKGVSVDARLQDGSHDPRRGARHVRDAGLIVLREQLEQEMVELSPYGEPVVVRAQVAIHDYQIAWTDLQRSSG